MPATIAAAVPPSGGTIQFAANATYDQLNRTLSVSLTPAPTQTTPTVSSVSFAHTYDATNRRVAQAVNDNGWWLYPTSERTVASIERSVMAGLVSRWKRKRRPHLRRGRRRIGRLTSAARRCAGTA